MNKNKVIQDLPFFGNIQFQLATFHAVVVNKRIRLHQKRGKLNEIKKRVLRYWPVEVKHFSIVKVKKLVICQNVAELGLPIVSWKAC